MKNSVFLIFLLVGLVFPSVGLAYKSIRFANNYEISTNELIQCEGEYHSDRTGRYYLFEMWFSGIEFPIVDVILAEEPDTWLGALKQTPPVLDWCAYLNRNLIVYHDKFVKTGIAFERTPEEMGLLALAWQLESGAGAIGLFILPILLVFLMLLGIYLFFEEVKKIYSIPAMVADQQENGLMVRIMDWSSWINRQFLPTVSVVLAGVLTASMGLVLVKGALFIEGTSYIYVLGGVLCLGLLIAALGPAFLLKLVHRIRTTQNPLLILLRNLLVILALYQLLKNTFDFLNREVTTELSSQNIWQFVWELIKALFS